MKKAKVIRVRRLLQPGVIVAVPRQGGGFYFLVHLTNNRFGEAFGLIEGHFAEAVIPEDRDLNPATSFIYTDNLYVRKGKWLCIGQCTKLLSSFPDQPEIFHKKIHHKDNPNIGPFGTGETAKGALRHLNQSEAQEIDLEGSYRHVLLEDEVEEYLNRKFG